MQADNALSRAVDAVNANRSGSVYRSPSSTNSKTAALAAAVAKVNASRSTTASGDHAASALAGAVAKINRDRAAA